MSKKEAKNTNKNNEKEFTNKVEGTKAIEALNEALGINDLNEKDSDLIKQVFLLKEKSDNLEKKTEELEREIVLLKELMARSLNVKSSKTLKD